MEEWSDLEVTGGNWEGRGRPWSKLISPEAWPLRPHPPGSHNRADRPETEKETGEGWDFSSSAEKWPWKGAVEPSVWRLPPSRLQL